MIEKTIENHQKPSKIAQNHYSPSSQKVRLSLIKFLTGLSFTKLHKYRRDGKVRKNSIRWSTYKCNLSLDTIVKNHRKNRAPLQKREPCIFQLFFTLINEISWHLKLIFLEAFFLTFPTRLLWCKLVEICWSSGRF